MLNALSTGAPDSIAPDGTNRSRPLRVGVLVDLFWTESAGGHVKFWERAAAAAAPLARDLDLTIHFAADSGGEYRLAENVRYRLHRPVFSTRRLPFLSHIPDHTDLAPYHRGLARHLMRYDVIHTTDAYFCFTKTAERAARRRGIPLVNSIHTDTPRYVRLYGVVTLRRILGDNAWSRRLAEPLAARAERAKIARLMRHHSLCAFVLGPREEDLARARRVLPHERVLPLKRGLEVDRFHPGRRDRAWLQRRFGVAPDTAVVLAVGRVDAGKNIMVLAEAVGRLAARGHELCLICAGAGDDRARVEAQLGERARCPGPVIGDELERLYASADVFAHPSEIESFANVVTEAMAAGLPALVSGAAVTRNHIDAGVSGLAVEPGVANWADAIETMLADGERRSAMGRAARQRALAAMPNWEEVVARHFLPIWRSAYQSTVDRRPTTDG